MTDSEYSVLDELYFIQTYSQLEASCDLAPQEILITLKSLYKRNWIRVLKSVDRNEEENNVDFDSHHDKYFYLASKKGLFAHNSI